MRGLRASEDVGYVTFVLFPRHLKKERREEVISHIQTFRDYFHYHIKAAKVSIFFSEVICEWGWGGFC